MNKVIIALAVILLTINAHASAWDTQVNTTLTWSEGKLIVKYIHRDVFFADLQENEYNLGVKLSPQVALLGSYITNSQDVERVGLAMAITKPLEDGYRLTMTFHAWKGLNGASERYKATMTILKPINKHWQVGIYALGNRAVGNPNEYFEGGPALVYQDGPLTIPAFLLLKDEGKIGFQLNLNGNLNF